MDLDRAAFELEPSVGDQGERREEKAEQCVRRGPGVSNRSHHGFDL
jgi:hypothetical protein